MHAMRQRCTLTISPLLTVHNYSLTRLGVFTPRVRTPAPPKSFYLDSKTGDCHALRTASAFAGGRPKMLACAFVCVFET